MRADEEARWLLQQYLSELAAVHNHNNGTLHLLCDAGLDFFAKQAWIVVTLNESSSAADVSKVRAFIEIVGQLSQSADFQWREYYHSFWKDELMEPLACSICCKERCLMGTHPEPTELDNFEQLMESKGPRFVFNFSHVKQDQRLLEMLRDLLLTDPKQALGEENSAVLSRLAAEQSAHAGRPSERIKLGLTLPSSLCASEF